MPKKIKYIAQPSMVEVSPYTAEEQESRYKKDYEFNKRTSVRSPVTGWEDKYIREDKAGYTPPKEVAMVKGTPYKFKHRRTGNIYGNRRATRKV